jgi:hypothetical protein
MTLKNYEEIVKISRYSESDWINYRIRSNYYFDYENTKRRLERNLKNYKQWINGNIEKKKELESDNGKKKFLDKRNKEIENRIKNNNEFLKRKITIKLQDGYYERDFSECENLRMNAPITFDNKWK